VQLRLHLWMQLQMQSRFEFWS